MAPRPPHILFAAIGLSAAAVATAAPLGLPEPPVPSDNAQSADKITLGERLYNDKRFSSTGEVACATCHAPEQGFTDRPLSVSVGIEGKTGTRNAPTVINAAYATSMFWDGRSPDLEDQALHPFLNPVEMGLTSHDQIIEVIKGDADYVAGFNKVFGVGADAVTIRQVTQAIAAFERTIIAGASPFDRWFYGDEADAMTAQQQEGYALFIGAARCADCHVIEQTQAIFTDNRFHNIGVGFNGIQDNAPELVGSYLEAERTLTEVDIEVLTDPASSELGRFAVNRDFGGIGAFKTPTVRNVAVTGPYMHDGSISNLREVVTHYNNGGVTNEGDPVNDFLSGGIRPLDLTEAEIDAVVAFLEALTSPQFADQVATSTPTPQ